MESAVVVVVVVVVEVVVAYFIYLCHLIPSSESTTTIQLLRSLLFRLSMRPVTAREVRWVVTVTPKKGVPIPIASKNGDKAYNKREYSKIYIYINIICYMYIYIHIKLTDVHIC